MKSNIKIAVSAAAIATGIDAWFRYKNKNKLLVVMYHGVTRNAYNPPVWTQLPIDKFKQQLDFLNQYYSIVSLDQVLKTLDNEASLPDNAALITFDDGYKNNFSVAFPVLQELNIPATIFVTVDRIGTGCPLWFDEIYLLLHSHTRRGKTLPFANKRASDLFSSGRTWDAYCVTVEALKKCGEDARERYLLELRESARCDDTVKYEDFCLLGWDDVFRMRDSGLISFGVHTATHRILAELSRKEWDHEIKESRIKLERHLGISVKSFCFPNGRPGIDFDNEHISYLKKTGYFCSFTTKSDLFCLKNSDKMQISRIAAGNDISSNFFFFRLNCSGFIPCISNLISRR
jgi:peptidoglycan/xylan/chitin deacetylase (PgdA/CDA1 family)